MHATAFLGDCSFRDFPFFFSFFLFLFFFPVCSAFTDRNMTTDPKSGARGRPRGITGARSAAETKHRPRSVALLVWEGVGRSACPPSPRGPAKKERKLAFGGAPAAPTQHGSVPRQPRRAVDGAPLARPSSPRGGRVCVSSKSLLRQDAGFFLLDIIRGMRRILVWKYCFLWIGVCVTDA